jgi:conjugal transfer protein traF
MNFEINKGIGRNVEFKGLESQYLFVFAAGLLAVFVVFVILYMAGVNQWVCIGFGVVAATLLVWLTFRLNARYGTHGLMKAAARKRHPRYVLNRLKIPRLFHKSDCTSEKQIDSLSARFAPTFTTKNKKE